MGALEALRTFAFPPGFGFHPTDVELISHYLKRKILGLKIDFDVIEEIDIYKHEPWDLPARCPVPTRDSKWHFFASRDKKYPNGSRLNRTTVAGYWKSTGKDRSIKYQNRVIGTRKTLVFHEGRPPCGKHTDWIMHEYYINENECKAATDMKDTFVLCRVTKRNGWGLEGENVGEEVSPQSENVQSENVGEEVSPQSENVQSENVENTDDSSKQPEDLAILVAPEKSSSPSENAEDISAWLTELIDLDLSAIPMPEVMSEPQEAHSALVLNPEPIDAHYPPGISDDSHLLFQVEEFYDILQCDGQNFDAFGEFNFGDMGTFGEQQGDIFGNLISNEFPPHDETWSGVQVREREAKPASGTLNQRIRLQTRKMESRNGESLSGTIEVNQDFHLDPWDEKQVAAESKPLASKTAVPKDVNAKKQPGFMKGLCDFFGRCSSASMNCFFLCTCMMGIAALIYFLLRDASFIGKFSVLEP